jgi:cytochrome d ubiquinol oxidase subunit II
MGAPLRAVTRSARRRWWIVPAALFLVPLLAALAAAVGEAVDATAWSRLAADTQFVPALWSSVWVGAVATVLAGWGFGQYPWLLVDQVTIDEGAGADATLVGLLVATGLACVVVLPPLVWLFRFTQQAPTGTAGPEREEAASDLSDAHP